MARMIQIRNVPDELHRKLKAWAASEGLSLSDDLLREAEQVVARPTHAPNRESGWRSARRVTPWAERDRR